MLCVPEGDPRLFNPGPEAFSCLPGHRGLRCRYQSTLLYISCPYPPIFFFQSFFFSFSFSLSRYWAFPFMFSKSFCSPLVRFFTHSMLHELYVLPPHPSSSITVTFLVQCGSGYDYNVANSLFLALKCRDWCACSAWSDGGVAFDGTARGPSVPFRPLPLPPALPTLTSTPFSAAARHGIMTDSMAGGGDWDWHGRTFF